jgi:hypothetical protein
MDRFLVHTDADFLFATKISQNFGIANSQVLRRGGGGHEDDLDIVSKLEIKNALSVSVTSAHRLHISEFTVP